MINLNKKLSFEKKTIITNDYGDQIEEWSFYKNIWGNIMPISVTNEFSNYISETKITHEIVIRYLNKIDINMRIIYNKRKFIIKSVINMNEQDKYYKMLCEELV